MGPEERGWFADVLGDQAQARKRLLFHEAKSKSPYAARSLPLRAARLMVPLRITG